jgi:hypothetical protein
MRDTTGNDHQSSPGGFETNPVCFGSLEKTGSAVDPEETIAHLAQAELN